MRSARRVLHSPAPVRASSTGRGGGVVAGRPSGWTVVRTARGRQRPKGCNVRCRLAQRFSRARRRAEAGMTTAEYAVGTLAACAFAAVLLAVVRSGGVKSALAAVITAALGVAG
ncbi:MAG: DUF4244 domain-containing protein [Pedococcus sp.]